MEEEAGLLLIGEQEIMETETQKYDYCQQAIAIKKHTEVGFVALAGHLYHIREDSLWNVTYSSFQEFSDELKMSQSTISKLINIYKKFVIEYGFTDDELSKSGGWSILAETLPLISSRSHAEHWLELSTTLTASDLRKEVLEAKNGITSTSTTTTCEHPDLYITEICPDCGYAHKLA